jgi:hypothetical protein
MMKSAFCQHLKFNWPNDGNSHILTSVSNNCTSKKVWINSHETFLVKAEISKEFSIFLKVFSKLNGWLISEIWIIKDIIACWSKNVFMLKKAALRNKKSNIIINWEDHKVPIDCVKKNPFHVDNDISRILSLSQIVQCISSWIFDLQILCRNKQSYQRNQKCVIFLILGHLTRIYIHQVYSMMYCLVVCLKSISYKRQIIYSFHTFLKKNK